jgi:hypothetical protein
MILRTPKVFANHRVETTGLESIGKYERAVVCQELQDVQKVVWNNLHLRC